MRNPIPDGFFNKRERNTDKSCSDSFTDLHLDRGRGGLTPRDIEFLCKTEKDFYQDYYDVDISEVDFDDDGTPPEPRQIRYQMRKRAENVFLDMVLISYRMETEDFNQVVKNVSNSEFDVSRELISILFRAFKRVGQDPEKEIRHGLREVHQDLGLGDVRINFEYPDRDHE